MRDRWRSARSSLVLVLLVTVVASCSAASEEEAANPYAPMFEQARSEATSQFELDVLADDVVTRAEYEEAMQRYVSCIEDMGSGVTLEESGGYYTYMITGDAARYDAISDDCSRGTNEWIEALFVETLMNPDNRDYFEIIAECLVETGIVDPPFGKDELLQLEESAGQVSQGQGGTPDNTPVDPQAEAILSSDGAAACYSNPSYYLSDGSGDR